MTPVKAVLGTLVSPTTVTAWSKQKCVSQSYWKMGGEVPAPQSSELRLQQPRRRQRAEESRMPCISLTPLICPHFSLFIFDRPREGLGITNNEVGEGIGTDKMDRALQDVKLAESSVCPLKSLGWLLTLMGWRQTPEEAFYFSEKTKLTKGQSSWHSCKSGMSKTWFPAGKCKTSRLTSLQTEMWHQTPGTQESSSATSPCWSLSGAAY